MIAGSRRRLARRRPKLIPGVFARAATPRGVVWAREDPVNVSGHRTSRARLRSVRVRLRDRRVEIPAIGLHQADDHKCLSVATNGPSSEARRHPDRQGRGPRDPGPSGRRHGGVAKSTLRTTDPPPRPTDDNANDLGGARLVLHCGGGRWDAIASCSRRSHLSATSQETPTQLTVGALSDRGSRSLCCHAPVRAQQSKTDQQRSFRNRWSSSTSSRIASGSSPRCHRHSSKPTASDSPAVAAARAALIA